MGARSKFRGAVWRKQPNGSWWVWETNEVQGEIEREVVQLRNRLLR